jgi:hypothetical protein
MRKPVSALSAVAYGAAAVALLSVPAATSASAQESATVRPASSPAAGHVFQDVLASGATLSTLDYSEPSANCAHDPSC